MLLVLAILIGAIAFQSLQTRDLERQLVREQTRVSGLKVRFAGTAFVINRGGACC